MSWSHTYGAVRREIIAELCQGWEREGPNGTVKHRVLKHCCRGNVLYTVDEREDPSGEISRTIGVHLLGKSHGVGWGCNSMCEGAMPYYFNCPISYIELAELYPLPPGADVERALQWRAKVRELDALRKVKYLPGSVVEASRPLEYGNHIPVRRFRVHSEIAQGRALRCLDADGRALGYLRLDKVDIA